MEKTPEARLLELAENDAIDLEQVSDEEIVDLIRALPPSSISREELRRIDFEALVVSELFVGMCEKRNSPRRPSRRTKK